ncbi:MAG: hypothetical protein GXP02_08455 [Alphaproteobacteria bacterium]|nr:hypothetical protein [Alphaproteobacteria bacterium]
MLTIITLVIFAVLMLRAAYSDLSSYTLSNRLCLGVALLYPLYLFALYMDGHGLSMAAILMSLGLALIIFIIGMGLFALNLMGGGDVKLMPAVALWAGAGHIINYLFITAIVGGIFAVIIIVRNRRNQSKYYKSSENINLSVTKITESAVPYGVGIAVGGLYVAYQLVTTFSGNLV